MWQLLFRILATAILVGIIYWLSRGAYKRQLRARRLLTHHLCPRCSYDLRGCMDEERCPECGEENPYLAAEREAERLRHVE